MRYIKVLVLAVILFVAMVFFFQNQEPLSHEIALNLNLYFMPPMQSIPLPFYFIIIASFFVGCLFCLCMLIWDRWTIGAKSMKKQWKINSLEKEVTKLQKELNDNAKDFAKSEELLAGQKKLTADTPAK